MPLHLLRFSIRKLRRDRLFVAVAVLSLGAAVACVTTMLSVVQAIDLRDLPFRDPGTLVSISQAEPSDGDCPGCAQRPTTREYLTWHGAVRTLSQIESSRWQSRELVVGDDRQRVDVREATPGFLQMLGIAPAIGRGFDSGDTVAGAPPVALLSNAVWRTTFGADSAVVGKTLSLISSSGGREPVHQMYRVIGVLPKDFVFDGRAGVWTLLDVSAARGRQGVEVIGRVAAGATVHSVVNELQLLQSRSGADAGTALRPVVETLRKFWVSENGVATERFALLAAALLVVLVAALNVAGLSVARSIARDAERAVFLALGASRSWLALQFAVETCLVTVAASVAGIVLAVPATRLATSHFHLNLLGARAFVSLEVVAAVLLLMLMLGAAIALGAFGVVRRSELAARLRGARADGQGGLSAVLRYLFVGAEVAVAVVLLAGAGLLAREYLHIVRSEIGFDPEDLWTVVVKRPQLADTGTLATTALAEEAGRRFRRIPGVEGISMRAGDWKVPSRVQGGVRLANDEPLVIQDVAPDYFDVMGVPVLRGRAFADFDRVGSESVVIVNRRAAARIWPGRNPLGEIVRFGSAGQEQTARVVGVVGDYEMDGYLPPQRILFLYRPLAQGTPAGLTAVVRLSASDSASLMALRRAAADLRGAPVGSYEIVSVERLVDAGLQAPAFNATALGLLGWFGLLLACLGVYGIIASSVIRRTREIGIRIALGASPVQLVRDLCRGAVILLALATVAGVVLALDATTLLKNQLFATSPTDIRSFAAAASMLIFVGGSAALIPARRVMSLNVSAALRAE